MDNDATLVVAATVQVKIIVSCCQKIDIGTHAETLAAKKNDLCIIWCVDKRLHALVEVLWVLFAVCLHLELLSPRAPCHRSERSVSTACCKGGSNKAVDNRL